MRTFPPWPRWIARVEVGEGLHVDAAVARKLLREILASGTLTYSGHAQKEMAADNLTTQDVMNGRGRAI